MWVGKFLRVGKAKSTVHILRGKHSVRPLRSYEVVARELEEVVELEVAGELEEWKRYDVVKNDEKTQ